MDIETLAHNLLKHETENHKMQRSKNRVAFDVWRSENWNEISDSFENSLHVFKDDLVVISDEPGGRVISGPWQVLGFDYNGNLFLDWDDYEETLPVENVVMVATKLEKGGER